MKFKRAAQTITKETMALQHFHRSHDRCVQLHHNIGQSKTSLNKQSNKKKSSKAECSMTVVVKLYSFIMHNLFIELSVSFHVRPLNV